MELGFRKFSRRSIHLSWYSDFVLILCCIHQNKSHGEIIGNLSANKNSCQPVYLFSDSNPQDTSYKLCADVVIFNAEIFIANIQCGTNGVKYHQV